MAKKVIAVTGIKHNGTFYAPGETLDVTKFTRVQLEALHDVQSIKIEDIPEPVKSEKAPKPEAIKTTEETPKVASAPSSATSVKSATTKAGTANGAGNAK